MLSFSKLDASMLLLSPKTCLPGNELANSLKLFTLEARRKDIGISYTTDSGYSDIGVSWAKVSFPSIRIIFGMNWTDHRLMSCLKRKKVMHYQLRG